MALAFQEIATVDFVFMKFGAQSPAWVRLHQRLITLQETVGARLSLITDHRASLFCIGWYAPSERPPDDLDRQLVAYERALNQNNSPIELSAAECLPFVKDILDTALAALSAEKKAPTEPFTICLYKEPPCLVFQSLTAPYCLLLEFEKPFDPESAIAEVRVALPTLDALVLALPSLDDPPRGAAAKRVFFDEHGTILSDAPFAVPVLLSRRA